MNQTLNEFCCLGIKSSQAEKTLEVNFPLIDYCDQAIFRYLKKKTNSSQKNGYTLLNSTALTTIKQVLDNWKYSSVQEKTLFQAQIHYLENFKKKENNHLTKKIIFINLLDKTKPIQTIEEAYFKLHLISARKVKPHQINLENLFKTLPNNVWTNHGPVTLEKFTELKLNNPHLSYQVSHVDKFPYLVNYYIPSGIRIADGSRVRLGAYLGEGTTVMPAGYINFNAGTLGASMIEGRVSAGVLIGAESDVGGGASIMGTLSGGNDQVISIGRKCLIGANAGTGISLGFGCTIAAGVYVTAGSKVNLFNEKKEPINLNNHVVEVGKNIVKGIELSEKDNLLFLQDSTSGELKCYPNLKTIQLNQVLHSYN